MKSARYEEVVIQQCSRNDNTCPCDDGSIGALGKIQSRQRDFANSYVYKVILGDGRRVWVHEEALDRIGGFEYGLWIE